MWKAGFITSTKNSKNYYITCRKRVYICEDDLKDYLKAKEKNIQIKGKNKK
jgi:hypothetical protein